MLGHFLSFGLIGKRFTTTSSRPSPLVLQRTQRRYTSSLLYVDKGAVVVNKPPGLVCQLGHNEESRTQRKPNEGDFETLLNEIQDTLSLPERPYPLHRLDKSTTGTLALALNRQTARDLSQQFQAHNLDKTYLAIVRGGERSFRELKGVITNYLRCESDGSVSVTKKPEQKSKKDRHRWISPAETEWELVASSPSVPLSLMKLTLRTGLKHQLRVHMAQVLQAPILGDTRHASSKISEKITSVVQIPPDYLYLHASSLSFSRYFPKQTRVKVVAPLPGYFTKLCAKVGIHIPSEFTKDGVWKDSVEVKNVVKDFLGQEQVDVSPPMTEMVPETPPTAEG
ncbi:unnamed protein product [Somion occarium]|uniref:Pseudouridine synthase RsuA/RluA-like domain-containing protein n=1 Tax=Somion occarium TaxID=3059160 RepID=A0ABP1CSX3_9APHY